MTFAAERNLANRRPVVLKFPTAAVDSEGNLCSRRSEAVNVENAGNREEV